MKSKVTAESTLCLREQEELAQLRKEVHSLKLKLRKEQPGHEVYKMLVDLAEETYGIEIKKLRCQVVQRFTEAEQRPSVVRLCELLGFSRQAYYKRNNHALQAQQEDILASSIVFYCQYLRQEEHLPKAGCQELYLLCKQHFKEHFTLGRDSFYALLRANGLMRQPFSVHHSVDS